MVEEEKDIISPDVPEQSEESVQIDKLTADMEAIQHRLDALDDVQNEAVNFVPKGVNFKLTSPQSISPGHKHVEADIDDLAHKTTLDSLDDVATIVEARGQILFRAASEWDALSPGTDGQLLKTQGAGADPVWVNAPTADIDILLQDWVTVNLVSGQSETTLKTFTIPGGTIGANDGIRVTIFHGLNNSGTARFRFKLDGDILMTNSEQSAQTYHTTFQMFNKNSTSSNSYFVNMIGVTAALGGAVFEEGGYDDSNTYDFSGDIILLLEGSTDGSGPMNIFGWTIEHLKA